MTRRFLSALLLSTLLLGACSGSSSSSGAPDTGSPLDLVAVPDGAMGPELGEDASPDLAPGEDSLAQVDTGWGFEYPCAPNDYESCVTSCGSAGQRRCLKDWGPCLPPPEWCGNCVDDDCDGLVNEDCAFDACQEPPPPSDCPVAVIRIQEGGRASVGATLRLSAADSFSEAGPIVQWQWGVQAPAGSASGFQPSAAVESPSFLVDVAGDYLFTVEVWDQAGNRSCFPAQAAVYVEPYPPVDPEVGCADGEREGFLDMAAYPQIAGCAGAWSLPGVSPDSVVPACGRLGGDDGERREGAGCSAADLCAEGWHICRGWQEVAAKSPAGCVDATPPGALSKSLFFACAQPSENNSVCGAPGDGFNDVFGCGNLGHALPPGSGCGPLDRALASMHPDTCGFNEAEPNLGPWQCVGGTDSHLREGALVTKIGCPNQSCMYDGRPVGNSDKGGVLCCRD